MLDECDLAFHLEVCVPGPAIHSTVHKESIGISRCQMGWAREELAELDVSAGVYSSHSAAFLL